MNFHRYRPNVFSKLLWIVQWFLGLWYTLPAFLSKIKLEHMPITVLNQSYDLSQTINILKASFHCYRPNVFQSFQNCSKALWLLTNASFFVKNETGTIADHGFGVISWTYKNYYFLEKKFSMLLSQCIFKAPLNGFYDLGPMIHDKCIFTEYQTGPTADHCFERST